jgi:PAS domain S-box-containing protein
LPSTTTESLKLRSRARTGAAVLVIVGLIVSGWVYLDWSRYRTASAEAARSKQILESTEKLVSSILDAESSQRGFLLTGEERYLVPYAQAVRVVPDELSTLSALIGRDSEQATNLQTLSNLIGQKMSEMEETVILRRTKGAQAAMEIVLSDRGRATMDRLRAILVVLQRGELSSETRVSEDAQAATTVLLLVTVAGTLVLIFFFVAALDPVLQEQRVSRFMPYAVAVGAALVALFLRMPLVSVIGPVATPFLTFLPAVLFASWYAGVRAGATTVALLATASAYFIFGPFPLSRADRQASGISLVFFMLVSIGIVFLAQSQRQAIERAAREAAQRRAAEESERAQRQEFETTLASIGDAVISTDMQGRIRFLNDVARGILRYPNDALYGRPLDEVFRIFNEDTREPVESPVAKVLREGHVAGMANHTILIAGDGTEVPVDDSGSPVRGADGQLRGVVLVFRDVSERREQEKALERQAASLQESESLFRTLANAIPQLAWMAKDDGWVFWYNDRWYQYTGVQPADVEGWGWQDVNDPRMLPEIMERWARSIATRTAFEMVVPLRGKDGVFRQFLTRVNPLRDSDGKVLRWLGTGTDISEHLRVEQGLRDTEGRLERLNAEMARSNADLRQFAFVASHDLQEPLRIITTYAQLLMRKYPVQTDEEAGLIVHNIVNGTVRMRTLLADLLQYAEIGASSEHKDQMADLAAIIEHVKQNLKDPIEASGAVIECGPLPIVQADGTYLIPLFQNLASNAIKYRNSQPPRIRITVEHIGAELRYAVSDNGIGIEPEFHRKIFDVFQRLHGKDVPGTGLGLAICKRVVERYHGRIWVESRPGSGSTFYFTLPDAKVSALDDSADRAFSA